MSDIPTKVKNKKKLVKKESFSIENTEIKSKRSPIGATLFQVMSTIPPWPVNKAL